MSSNKSKHPLHSSRLDLLLLDIQNDVNDSNPSRRILHFLFHNNNPRLPVMCLNKRTEWNHRCTYDSAFPPHSAVWCGLISIQSLVSLEVMARCNNIGSSGYVQPLTHSLVLHLYWKIHKTVHHTEHSALSRTLLKKKTFQLTSLNPKTISVVMSGMSSAMPPGC